jgi:hypothetical protein
VTVGFEPAAEPSSGFDPLGWAWGQCTAFAAEVASWVQGNVKGNADQWLASGQAAGLATSLTPEPGDVAVFSGALPGSGGYGHVAVVTAVSGDQFSVDQGNVAGLDVASTGEYSSDDPYLLGFLVAPNPGAAAQTVLAATAATPAGSAQAQAQAFAAAAASSSTSSTSAPSSDPASSIGGAAGGAAATGLVNLLSDLEGWFDTPRLIGFSVAAVVMYLFWGPSLTQGDG